MVDSSYFFAIVDGRKITYSLKKSTFWIKGSFFSTQSEGRILFNPFNDSTLLITGGTGSFGQAFIKRVLQNSQPKKIIVFSRDEWKQSQMQEEEPLFRSSCMRYFLGDVRDVDRLKTAFREVDYIIHAAALKQVPAAEYNPSECIKTNIQGTLNVVQAAINESVKKVVLLSTDKAVGPINLYGATKLCAEKVVLSGSVYVGNRPGPIFCVVRYGNVIGSKGSLIPKWQKQIQEGVKSLPITDKRMTRFWMTLEHAVDLVIKSLFTSKGGEVFIPKIPSMKIVDLAKALAPHLPLTVCGIRPGEKLHERLITQDESFMTVEYEDHYVLYSPWSPKQYPSNVPQNFEYRSDTSSNNLTREGLKALLSLDEKIAEKVKG